jgi:hypothetical protein
MLRAPDADPGVPSDRGVSVTGGWGMSFGNSRMLGDHTRFTLVGVAGFEPAASCSQGTRANQAALHPVGIHV